MHFDFWAVPIGAFAVAIVAIISGVMSEANRQRLTAEQRMAMVARGMPADDIDKLLTKAIVDMLAAAGEPNEGAEDHRLMVSDDLLEAGVGGVQRGSD